MAKLTIEQAHSLSPDEVRKRLDAMNDKLAKYGVNASWTSATEAAVSGAGAKGKILIEPSRVQVHLDLNMALSLMKGKIETKVRDELQRALA